MTFKQSKKKNKQDLKHENESSSFLADRRLFTTARSLQCASSEENPPKTNAAAPFSLGVPKMLVRTSCCTQQQLMLTTTCVLLFNRVPMLGGPAL